MLPESHTRVVQCRDAPVVVRSAPAAGPGGPREVLDPSAHARRPHGRLAATGGAGHSLVARERSVPCGRVDLRQLRRSLQQLAGGTSRGGCRLRSRVCNVPGCPVIIQSTGRCGGSCCDGRCADRRGPDLRPTAAARGYGNDWRRRRAAFLAANPTCAGDGAGGHHPNCDGVATVPDHHPLTRRELVAQGVEDPDAAEYLVGRSAACHGRKTVQLDGGWGKRIVR